MPLVEKCGKLIAVEIDRRFKFDLEKIQKQHNNLEVIFKDAMTVKFSGIDKVVSNLPYKTALPLIFRIINSDIKQSFLIVQENLARRLSAGPGNKGYSRISILVHRESHIKIIKTISKINFSPTPKVDSALIHIAKIKPKFSITSEEHFNVLLDNLFLYRYFVLKIALKRIQGMENLEFSLKKNHPYLLDKKIFYLTPEEFAILDRLTYTLNIKLSKVPVERKRKAQKYTN